MTKDLVCGMDVSETETTQRIKQNGVTYYFCSEQCKENFSDNPERYLHPRKKGVFTRFLERLAKENNQAFGNKKPSCH